jgi:hypothetical protein
VLYSAPVPAFAFRRSLSHCILLSRFVFQQHDLAKLKGRFHFRSSSLLRAVGRESFLFSLEIKGNKTEHSKQQEGNGTRISMRSAYFCLSG